MQYKVINNSFSTSEHGTPEVGQIIDLADGMPLVLAGKIVPVNPDGKEIMQNEPLTVGIPANKTGKKIKSGLQFYRAHQELGSKRKAPDYVADLANPLTWDLASTGLLRVGYELRDEERLKEQLLIHQSRVFLNEFVEAINQTINDKVSEINARVRLQNGKLTQGEKRQDPENHQESIKQMGKKW